MINIVRIYIYIFPILLALIYLNMMSKYRLELSILTLGISLIIYFKKVRNRYVFILLLLSIILFGISFLFSNNNNQFVYDILYLFSSIIYISIFIHFMNKYSYFHKYQYMKYLEYIIYLFMAMPFYNYLTRPIYNGGNQMMYYIIGIYLLYLALSINMQKINRNYLLLFIMLVFDMLIAKNRGSFPLILSLFLFNIYIYNLAYIKGYYVKNITFIIVRVIIIFIIGLLPILMYFGLGESLLSIFIARTQTYSDGGVDGRLWLFIKWIEYFYDIYILNVISISPQDMRIELGPHNTILYLVYNYSIFGIVMYFYFIYKITSIASFITNSFMLKTSIILILISIVMLLNTASLFLTHDSVVWIGIILFFYSLHTRIKQKSIKV